MDGPDRTADRAAWVVDFNAWFAQGEALAREEEGPGGPPDPDDYAAYDDEAARLAMAAYALWGRSARKGGRAE